MVQSHYSQASELDIRRQMGSGFSEAVMQLEPDQWHGPVLSGYGVHLVYVYEFKAAPPPAFEDVREIVLQNWQTEQQENFNAEYLEGLKSRYNVVIAEVPAELILDVGAAKTGEVKSDDENADQTNTAAEPAS